MDWGKKWLVGFNAGKTQLFLFDQSNNTSAFLVKMDGSVPEEISSFKMLGLAFFSKLDWASYITLLLKVLPRKFGLDPSYIFSTGITLVVVHLNWPS